MLGNQMLHAIHLCSARMGVLWCWRCGGYTTGVLRSLADKCPGHPRTPNQEYTLSRIRAGKTPKPGMAWPRPDIDVPLDVVLEEAPAPPKLSQEHKRARRPRRQMQKRLAAPDRAVSAKRPREEKEAAGVVDLTADTDDEGGECQFTLEPTVVVDDTSTDYDVFGFLEE